MPFYKSLRFNENDKDLVDRIIAFQNENNLTFVAAVRKLCSDALDLKRITK